MTNLLFKKALEQVSSDARVFVGHSFDIADRIYFLKERNGWTNGVLAEKMGKTPSEISRFLSGTHNFTLQTISKLEAVLGEPIIRCLASREEKEATVKIAAQPSTMSFTLNREIRQKGTQTMSFDSVPPVASPEPHIEHTQSIFPELKKNCWNHFSSENRKAENYQHAVGA